MEAVYRIINSKNGRYYIGSSLDYKKRKRDHFNLLKGGNHHNKPMQEDYNIYGAESFKFEVLKLFNGIDRNALFDIEQEFISKSNESMRYNLYDNAFGMSYRGKDNPMFGKTHSEEIRQKLSEINSGENNPWYGNSDHMEMMRSRITKRFDGRKHTEETKLKMSVAHMGREKTESERHRLRLNNGNNVGIFIDGLFYRSMAEASRQLGISRTTITSRVNNPRFKNYYRCSEGVETTSKPEISAG